MYLQRRRSAGHVGRHLRGRGTMPGQQRIRRGPLCLLLSQPAHQQAKESHIMCSCAAWSIAWTIARRSGTLNMLSMGMHGVFVAQLPS